jgi:hypothetical protein
MLFYAGSPAIAVINANHALAVLEDLQVYFLARDELRGKASSTKRE